ncbi:paired box Pax-7-like, partial [Paramuricea clavata]
MIRHNNLGGTYVRGKSTPSIIRSRIVLLFYDGKSMKDISDDVKLSVEGVRKILNSYFETHSISAKLPPGKDHSVITDNVLEHIEWYKTQKPSIYAREIRDRLIRQGVSDENHAPSNSAIAYSIRWELNLTRKRLEVIPVESLTPAAIEKQNRYFEEISEFPARHIHFMDEASVIHYYDVLEGPSNGLELLQFFSDALEQRYPNGNPILSAGDAVVMDNCGFHHARHVEPVLRELLLRHGVTLIFQPPYCPELNPCEYCFAHMRKSFRNNERFTASYTELAIVNAMEFITA